MADPIVMTPKEVEWLLPMRAVFGAIERDGGQPVIEVYATMEGIDEQVRVQPSFEDALLMVRTLHQLSEESGLPTDTIDIGVRVRRREPRA